MYTALSSLASKPTLTQVLLCNSSSPPSTAKRFLFSRSDCPSSAPLNCAAIDKRVVVVPCSNSSVPFLSDDTTRYEFNDDSSEIELRLELPNKTLTPSEISVDANDSSLVVKVTVFGYQKTLLNTNSLYGMIKPSETIWYIDDDQLVVSLKKQDPELKWPDIMESWESLTTGVAQLLKGTSVFLVGDSTDVNNKVARELAVGLRYTPLSTKELLETYNKQTIDQLLDKEGCDAIAEAESAIFESLSSQARAVIATLGGKHGAARSSDRWRHLFSGLTVWLLQTKATDEKSARKEVKKKMEESVNGYTNAESVVNVSDWDPTYSKAVAQASLSALKRLLLLDKQLTGRKSLYIRLGCRGDWPDIKPPGYDPSIEIPNLR